MKRQYFHCSLLEESPMWAKAAGSEADDYAEKAAELMKEPDVFADSMREALRLWPNSSAHNLSARSKNRRAWLGHAGCFLSTGSPESCTRAGWWKLDHDQQIEANEAADIVITEWENAKNFAGY